MFHFKQGHLPKCEWEQLKDAQDILGLAVFPQHESGFLSEDGTEYFPVDLIAEPDEIANAVKVFDALLQQFGIDIRL